MLVEFPGTVRRFGVRRPLLIDERAGVRENAMVEVRSIPGHRECARSARAAAHRGAGVWIAREFYVAARFDEREHFGFDEFGVAAGHGIVFEAALAALGIASTVGDRNGDHRGYAVLGDERVERGEQIAVGAIGPDDERGTRPGDVLLGNIDLDA